MQEIFRKIKSRHVLPSFNISKIKSSICSLFIYKHVCVLSHVWLFHDPMDCQTQVSCISCIGRQILYHCATWEALIYKKRIERGLNNFLKALHELSQGLILFPTHFPNDSHISYCYESSMYITYYLSKSNFHAIYIKCDKKLILYMQFTLNISYGSKRIPLLSISY